MKHWDLIAKNLTGEISEEEKLELDSWINESAENKKTYKESESAWKLTSNNATYTPNVESAWDSVNNKITTTKHSIKPPKKKLSLGLIAAIFIGIVAVGTLLNNTLNKEDYTIYTASNSVEHFTLKDGSEIWLNKNSEIKIKESFNEINREVLLNGEAFFEVKRNKEKLFIISTKLSKTTVLGTSFSVKGYDNAPINVLNVNTGKVEFTNGTEKEVFIAGERGELNKKEIVKTTVRINDFAWQKGIFTYKNTSLKNIANDLGKHYNVTISFKNESISLCTFTGDLSASNLTQNMEVIALTNNLAFNQNENTIVFSGEGCK
jgi:ferric-dicitrate binding protein FerR (iron transport regulator)